MEELQRDLAAAGINLYYPNGTRKNYNIIIDELVAIINILPPKLVDRIISNLYLIDNKEGG